MILTYILTLTSSSQNGESPQELVKFGVECLEIDSWVRRRQYSIIRDSLGSGTNTHLQENPLLRDIFGLGAPLVIGPGGHKKASKTERVSSVMRWYWAIPLMNYRTFGFETFPDNWLYTFFSYFLKKKIVWSLQLYQKETISNHINQFFIFWM